MKRQLDPPQRRAPLAEMQPPPKPAGRRRLELSVVIIGWTLMGAFLAMQNVLFFASQGVPISLLAVAGRVLLAAGVWATITLVAFSLSRRFPLDRAPRLRNALIHQTAGMALALFEVVIGFFALRAMDAPPEPFLSLFLRGFPWSLLLYWLFVGIGHGLEFYRRFRQRDWQSVQLTARLAQAELHLLKSQLQPHFLFNTLHAIAALMHKDVRAAERMIMRLSDLLRVALDHASATVVSLDEELEFLATYLDIERVRLGDRLTVDIDVQPEARGAEVPHMILQPLVENAVRHGIAPRAARGTIRVAARVIDDRQLALEVVDDGVGTRVAAKSRGGGLGLANTRARLEQLYGDDFEFDAGDAPAGGYRVTLMIPLRVPSTANLIATDVGHMGEDAPLEYDPHDHR